MRRLGILITSAIIVIAVTGGVGIRWALLRQERHQAWETFSSRVLVLTARLGQAGRQGQTVAETLRSLTVPGSQADFFTTWLAGQDALAARHSGFYLSEAKVSASHFSFSTRSETEVVSFHFVIRRRFYPRGTSTARGTATLWLTLPPAPLKVQALVLDFTPELPTGGSWPLNPDVWHLYPPPALPLGR